MPLVHLIFLIVAILDVHWGNYWRRNKTNRNDYNIALPKICYMSIYVYQGVYYFRKLSSWTMLEIQWLVSHHSV